MTKMTDLLKQNVKFMVMTESGIYAAVPKTEENSVETIAKGLVDKGITEFVILEIKGVYTEQKNVRNVMEEVK